MDEHTHIGWVNMVNGAHSTVHLESSHEYKPEDRGGFLYFYRARIESSPSPGFAYYFGSTKNGTLAWKKLESTSSELVNDKLTGSISKGSLDRIIAYMGVHYPTSINHKVPLPPNAATAQNSLGLQDWLNDPGVQSLANRFINPHLPAISQVPVDMRGTANSFLNIQGVGVKKELQQRTIATQQPKQRYPTVSVKGLKGNDVSFGHEEEDESARLLREWTKSGSNSASKALQRSMEDSLENTQKELDAEARKRRGGCSPSSTWTSTGRRVRLPDGTERVLFGDPARPGDLRVRKMVRKRSRLVATYVTAVA
jgi:hypothetical protein